MGTKWYFDTIEEAKAAMPNYARIYVNGKSRHAVSHIPGKLIGKFIPVDSEGADAVGDKGLWDDPCWKPLHDVDRIVDQIRNAETRAEAIQVARGYFDDMMHFGEVVER